VREPDGLAKVCPFGSSILYIIIIIIITSSRAFRPYPYRFQFAKSGVEVLSCPDCY